MGGEEPSGELYRESVFGGAWEGPGMGREVRRMSAEGLGIGEGSIAKRGAFRGIEYGGKNTVRGRAARLSASST